MPRGDELVCLVCGSVPDLLDTQPESSSPGRFVRRQLVRCRKCRSVRLYRVIKTTEDLGPYPKRYLREDSTAR